MREMPPGSVDLIYLDPPFNSNRAYNAIYRDNTKRVLPDQIEAFCDTWTIGPETERALRGMPSIMRNAGIDHETARFLQVWVSALRNTQPKLFAYLIYMAERLLVMKDLLKPTGSIYLHCDPTASHYLKVMMDGVFGHKNFRNEIVWCYKEQETATRYFPRKHDVILFYSKGNAYTFNVQWAPHSESQLRRYNIVKPDGRYANMKGKLRKLGPGSKIRDYWNIDIAQQGERVGYPTQKPLALMRRIISASSKPDDVVLDPFCGCATTIAAAQELERRWIGIDIAIHAIRRVVQIRLTDKYRLVEGQHYSVEGIPRNLEGVRDLWKRDRYHFQRWAIEQVDGFCTTRRTNDGGIDGRLYFHRPLKKGLQSMILEVKGGANVNASVVRDLRGTMEGNNALMAGLIVMESLSERKGRNFRREMAKAGDMDVLGVKYPRMQILSVEDIFNGKRFLTPSPAAGQGTGQEVLPLDSKTG